VVNAGKQVFCLFVSPYSVNFIVDFFTLLRMRILNKINTVNSKGGSKSRKSDSYFQIPVIGECELKTPECTKTYGRQGFDADPTGRAYSASRNSQLVERVLPIPRPFRPRQCSSETAGASGVHGGSWDLQTFHKYLGSGS